MEAAALKMLDRQRDADGSTDTPDTRAASRLERLHQEAKQLRNWLDTHPDDRRGAKGSVRLSNRTDNESAKMATSKGVIQGYTGVAAVDEQTQIVVEAQAHGTGSEQELLIPLIEMTKILRKSDTAIAADAGYHSEANLKVLDEAKVDAWLPDNGYRQRDERYADQGTHKAKPDPLHDKTAKPAKTALVIPTA